MSTPSSVSPGAPSNELKAFHTDYPVVIELAVQWGEMDAFNHVNNTVYFRYFESARLAYFLETDVMALMESKRLGPILASTDCRFRRPLTYPDSISVGARVSELHSHGFTMDYAVFSHTQDTVATTGGGRIVMVDYDSGAKVELSSDIAGKIQRIAGKAIPVRQ